MALLSGAEALLVAAPRARRENAALLARFLGELVGFYVTDQVDGHAAVGLLTARLVPLLRVGRVAGRALAPVVTPGR